MWVRMHQGEGIWVLLEPISITFLSTHTSAVLTCKSISTLESMRQKKKKKKKKITLVPFRQTAALCCDQH